MSDEIYLEYKSKLIGLLGLENSPLSIVEGGAEVRVGENNRSLLVSSRQQGLKPDIQFVTHEIGHMMIARDEDFGNRSWGMRNPNLWAHNGVIRDFESLTTSQIKFEAKAWAWQWIIDQALGIENANEPPARPEAQFLDNYRRLGDSEKERQENIGKLQIEFKARIFTQTPNPLQAIRDRIQNIPSALDKNFLLHQVIQSDWHTIKKACLEDIRAEIIEYRMNGTLAYSVQLSTPDDCRDSVVTFSRERAEHFFKCLIEINGLKKELENSTDTSVKV